MGNWFSNEKLEINQINSKDKFENIKNRYILQKVFNYWDSIKVLNLIKYNKNTMKRININIDDYKEYSEIFSSIEIEIKPINKKYGTFINFSKGEVEYYHIYFDNNKEEIKRNYINKDEPIEIIKIIIE